MMLGHLGEGRAAKRIRTAIDQLVNAGRVLTPDLRGTATTTEVANAICRALAA